MFTQAAEPGGGVALGAVGRGAALNPASWRLGLRAQLSVGLVILGDLFILPGPGHIRILMAVMRIKRESE